MHWEKMAELGGASEETVEGYHYLENQELINAAGKSSLQDERTSEGYPQACGPIRVGDRLIAYCGTMIEDLSVEDALVFNDLLIGAIQALLRKESPKALVDDMSDIRLMERLLSNEEATKEEVAAFAKRYEPPYMLALVRGQMGQSTLHYIQQKMTRQDHLLAFLHGADGICLLRAAIPFGQGVRTMTDMLAGMQKKYDVRGGFSDYFESVEELPDAYTQALLALVTGGGRSEEEAPICFRENYIDIILAQAIDRLGLTACQSPLIEKILRSREDAQSLLDTLEVYFASMQRISQTAEIMGIHKNTAAYRIRRVEQIVGSALSDTEVADQLEIGLKLYRLAETRKEEEGS